MGNELYIPVNTPDSDDYIAGIGNFEVAVIGSGVVIAIILGICLGTFLNNTLYGVFSGATIIAMFIITFRRDAYNENLIKKIRIVVAYTKAQKQFKYMYHDPYNFPDKDLEPYE